MTTSEKIQLIFEAQDKTSGKLKKLQGGIDKTAKKAQMLQGAFAAVFGIIGVQMVARFVTESIKQFAKFEQSMRNVNSIMQVSEKEFASMQQAVRDMSTEVPQAADVLAEGLYDIASAGFAGQEALELLEVAARGATAGVTDTKTASGALVTVLNAYGKPASEAADVMDILFKTVEKGVVTFPQLAASLGKVVATANVAKVPFDEVAAAIATMTKGGIKADIATTSLNKALLSIISPQDQASAYAKTLGIEFGSQALAAKGLAGVIAEVNEKTGGNVDALQKLFPELRAFKAVTSLARSEGKAYASDLEEIADNTNRVGATNKAFAEQSKSLNVQMQLLTNNVTELKNALLYELIPSLTNSTSALTNLLREMKKQSIGFRDVAGYINGNYNPAVANAIKNQKKLAEEQKKYNGILYKTLTNTKKLTESTDELIEATITMTTTTKEQQAHFKAMAEEKKELIEEEIEQFEELTENTTKLAKEASDAHIYESERWIMKTKSLRDMSVDDEIAAYTRLKNAEDIIMEDRKKIEEKIWDLKAKKREEDKKAFEQTGRDFLTGIQGQYNIINGMTDKFAGTIGEGLSKAFTGVSAPLEAMGLSVGGIFGSLGGLVVTGLTSLFSEQKSVAEYMQESYKRMVDKTNLKLDEIGREKTKVSSAMELIEKLQLGDGGTISDPTIIAALKNIVGVSVGGMTQVEALTALLEAMKNLPSEFAAKMAEMERLQTSSPLLKKLIAERKRLDAIEMPWEHLSSKLERSLEKQLEGLGLKVGGWNWRAMQGEMEAGNKRVLELQEEVGQAELDYLNEQAGIVNKISSLLEDIPGLASGGVVNKPTLALIGEKEPEAVIPLSKMDSGMGGITINFQTLIPDRVGAERAAKIIDSELQKLRRSDRSQLYAYNQRN